MWPDGDGWTLSDDPVLQIGLMEGEEPYLFDRVMGVARLDDGRIGVANMGDNTIRFFDSSGRYLMRVGGSGEGPGEFLQLMGLHRTAGRLYGNQFSLYPIRVFDEATGDLVGSLTPPTIEGFCVVSVRGLFDDGSMLLSDFPQGYPLQPGVYTMTSTVVRTTGSGEVDTVGVFPAVSWIAVGDRFPITQEFGPLLHLVAAGERLYQAYSAEYEISVRNLDGDLLRSVRRAWDPIPVTEAFKSRYRNSVLRLGTESGGAVSPRLRQQREDIVDAMIFPEHHPPYDRVLVDRTGHLWVRRTDPERQTRGGGFNPISDEAAWWDVFEKRGAWLGAVELPPSFVVFEIGDDYVAGLWKNDLDVEFVRVYDLIK